MLIIATARLQSVPYSEMTWPSLTLADYDSRDVDKGLAGRHTMIEP